MPRGYWITFCVTLVQRSNVLWVFFEEDVNESPANLLDVPTSNFVDFLFR